MDKQSDHQPYNKQSFRAPDRLRSSDDTITTSLTCAPHSPHSPKHQPRAEFFAYMSYLGSLISQEQNAGSPPLLR
jgi:hypothetical protein